jgi:uncharacterized PurR-regulated membrane protein YhhQ (DUF165 family)
LELVSDRRRGPGGLETACTQGKGRNMNRFRWGVLALAGYVGSIVLANWLIQHYGFVPVGFGLLAPAGTYAAGFVFVARDGLQLAWGRWLVLPAIVAGAAISWWTTSGGTIPGGKLPLAAASGLAFLLGELMDWTVFTPLRARGRFTEAFLGANTIGLLVDTFVFLWLAFGTVTAWKGTALGKFWVTLPACAVVWFYRRRLALQAAT